MKHFQGGERHTEKNGSSYQCKGKSKAAEKKSTAVRGGSRVREKGSMKSRRQWKEKEKRFEELKISRPGPENSKRGRGGRAG